MKLLLLRNILCVTALLTCYVAVSSHGCLCNISKEEEHLPSFSIHLDRVSTDSIWSPETNITFTLVSNSDYYLPPLQQSHKHQSLELRIDGYLNRSPGNAATGGGQSFRQQPTFFLPTTLPLPNRLYRTSDAETFHVTLRRLPSSVQDASSIYSHIPNGLQFDVLLRQVIVVPAPSLTETKQHIGSGFSRFMMKEVPRAVAGGTSQQQQAPPQIVERKIQSIFTPFRSINPLIGDTFQDIAHERLEELTTSRSLGKRGRMPPAAPSSSSSSPSSSTTATKTDYLFPMFSKLNVPMANVLILGAQDRNLFVNTLFSALSDRLKFISSPLHLDREVQYFARNAAQQQQRQYRTQQFIQRQQGPSLPQDERAIHTFTLEEDCRMRSYNLTRSIRLFEPLHMSYPWHRQVLDQLLLGKQQQQQSEMQRRQRTGATVEVTQENNKVHQRLSSQVHAIVILVSCRDMSNTVRMKQIQSTYTMTTELGFNPLVVVTRMDPEMKVDASIAKLSNLAHQLKCSPNRIISFDLYEENSVKSFSVDQEVVSVIHKILNLANDRLEYLMNTDQTIEQMTRVKPPASRTPFNIMLVFSCLSAIATLFTALPYLNAQLMVMKTKTRGASREDKRGVTSQPKIYMPSEDDTDSWQQQSQPPQPPIEAPTTTVTATAEDIDPSHASHQHRRKKRRDSKSKARSSSRDKTSDQPNVNTTTTVKVEDVNTASNNMLLDEELNHEEEHPLMEADEQNQVDNESAAPSSDELQVPPTPPLPPLPPLPPRPPQVVIPPLRLTEVHTSLGDEIEKELIQSRMRLQEQVDSILKKQEEMKNRYSSSFS